LPSGAHDDKMLAVQVSLLITTYNWPAALDLVLRSVQQQRVAPAEVIIADDGSTQETTRMVEAWRSRLAMPLLHVWQEDIGFRAARSRNRGIAAASCDYIVLLDGDMVLHRDFIADHAALAEAGCFVQGPRLNTSARLSQRMLAQGHVAVGPFTPGLRRRHQSLHSLWLARRNADAAYSISRVKSCNMGCWRKDLLDVNGFDEQMVGWGPEDKELAVRLFNIGVTRKHVRFAALATHLYHRTREPDGVNPNDAILHASIASRLKRCQLGIDAHLTEFARGVPLTARPPWSR
jgi:glycosyltransferase involved in cell wall biosynthesis